MAQEPTLQTIVDLINKNKVDTDKKFEAIGSRLESMDQKFIPFNEKINNLTTLIQDNKKDTDLKFEGLTEIIITNFDRLDKKIDDVRFELKEDIRAVVRVSSLLSPR